MLISAVAAVVFAQAQSAITPFPQVVLRNFEVWDTDRSGDLTQIEVDKAVLDSRFHGEDAAALAALHGWLAVDTEAVKLDKSWFQNYRSVKLTVPKGTPALEAKEQRKAYAKTPGSLESSYRTGLRRLTKKGATNLYEPTGPELNDIKQGALGDCYMLAPLGAMVHRDPKAIEGMIKPEDGGYTVHFSDGKDVHVAALTDSELAMGGSSTAEGLWIRVMEKAYGNRKIEDGDVKIARDGMNGGSSATAGKAFTGHKFSGIKLFGDYKADVSDSQMNQKLDQVRKSLKDALAQNQLVLAGTTKKDMPTSISPNHAYAIFAYDDKADKLTIWNPHGNDFKPKGPEGFQYGYARQNGVFTMPLSEFAHTFARIYFEDKQ